RDSHGDRKMYAKETLKRTLEHLTGIGRPSRAEVKSRINARKAWPSRFRDDGRIPNNTDLPLIHYRGAVELSGATDPAAVFEEMFATNGWRSSWRNGIYDYVHYHPRTHEVLGVADGKARVRFGGAKGKIVRLKAGDVVVLPAGTGHQALSASKDLVVVGAYPPGEKYEEFEGSQTEHARAVGMIPKVPLPRKDPVYGADGPLARLWRRKRVGARGKVRAAKR
ncbi:MAG: cupin domain-containing protein, partial [Pseudolabrys sp.]